MSPMPSLDEPENSSLMHLPCHLKITDELEITLNDISVLKDIGYICFLLRTDWMFPHHSSQGKL